MHDRELIGMISGDYGIANYSWCLEDNVEALKFHNKRGGDELAQAMFKIEADYTYITEEIMNIIANSDATITEFGDLKKVL